MCTPYAQKRQKLPAQGITLGYNGLKPYALNQRSPARSGKVKGKSFPLTQTFKAKTTKNGRKILYCLLFSVSLHPFLKFSSINRIIQKNRYDKQNRSKQFYSRVQTMDHGRLGIILSNGYVSYHFSPSSILVFLHKFRISSAASDTVKISVDKS